MGDVTVPDPQRVSIALMAFVNALAARGSAEHRARTLRALVAKLTVEDARAIDARLKPGGAWRHLLEEQLTASEARELLERIAQRAAGSTSSVRMTITPEQRGVANRGTENPGTRHRGSFSDVLGASATGHGVGAAMDESGRIQLPAVQEMPPPPRARTVPGIPVRIFVFGAKNIGLATWGKDRKALIDGIATTYNSETAKSNGPVRDFEFHATYATGEPSRAQKARFGALDFPVYVLGKNARGDVARLLKEHNIPKPYRGQDRWKMALDAWDNGTDNGVAAPPEPPKVIVKLGFVNYDNALANTSVGLPWIVLANVIGHELFHMAGVSHHYSPGLAAYPPPPDWGSSLQGLSSQARGMFFGYLTQLWSTTVSKKRGH